MLLHNPINQSRLCATLGENLDGCEAREVADGFKRCAGCACVLMGDAKSAPAQPAPDDAAT